MGCGCCKYLFGSTSHRYELPHDLSPDHADFDSYHQDDDDDDEDLFFARTFDKFELV